MNGGIGVPSTIGGRQIALLDYCRRRINSTKRRTIHKNRWISSSIEEPPFSLSIDMRVGHPHSYKGVYLYGDFTPHYDMALSINK